MPCDILYNGKKYTLAEFVKLLSENELFNKINDNTITGSLADGYRKSFAAEFPSPETQIKKEDDTENKPRVGGEVRVGEKPVETEPKPGAGREAAPTGRDVQGDVTAQEEKLGGQVVSSQPSPKKETKLQKQRREASEKVKEQMAKEQRRKEREEGAAITQKEKELKKNIMRERAKNAYEGVLRFFASGGKINARDFKREGAKGKTELFIRSGKGGILDAKNKSAGLDIIAMSIAEDMGFPDESFDQAVEEIIAELKSAINEISSSKQAFEKLIDIAKNEERIQVEEAESWQKAFEQDQFEKGAAPLSEYYTDEQLFELAKEAEMARAEFEKQEFGVKPTPKDELLKKRNDIRNRIREKSKGRLNAIPVDLIPEYVELAITYIQEGVLDAKEFVKRLKQDWPDLVPQNDRNLPQSEFDKSVEKELSAVFNLAMSRGTEVGDKALIGDEKMRAVNERLLDALPKDVSQAVKDQMVAKGVAYIEKPMSMTQDEAMSYVEAFVKYGSDTGTLDQAFFYLTNTSNTLPPDVRMTAASLISNEYRKQMRGAKTNAEKLYFAEKIAEVNLWAAEYATNLGRGINAVKLFYENIMSSGPEAVAAAVQAEINKRNAAREKQMKLDIKGLYDSFVQEFKKTAEFKEAVEKEATVKEKAKKIADSVRKAKINRPGIFMAATPISLVYDAAVETVAATIEAGGTLADAIQKGFDLIKNSDWYKSVTDSDREMAEREFGKAMDESFGEPKPKATKKPKVTSPKKAKAIEDLSEKLKGKAKGLSGKKLSKFLSDVFDKYVSTGDLTYQQFKEIYEDALGFEKLTEQDLTEIEKNAKTTQQAWDATSDYFENPNSATRGKAQKMIFKAKKANADISKYFAPKRNLPKMLTTFIQGNLLTGVSIAANFIGNITMLPFRSFKLGAASIMDYALSKASAIQFLSQMVDSRRTIDWFAVQSGYPRGFLYGGKIGAKEVVSGVLPTDAYKKDIQYQIRPYDALKRFYDVMSGKSKQKTSETIYDAFEGIFGIAPDAVFRLLNLGDKPYSTASRWGRAFELAAIEKLGKEETMQLVLFPERYAKENNRPDLLEEIERAGEKATYQDDNAIAGIFQNFKNVIPKEVMERYEPVIGWLEMAFRTQAIYLKTPLNLLKEAIRYGLPEVSFSLAVYEASRGNRRRSLEYFGEASVGFALRASAAALILAGVIEPPEDEEDKIREGVKTITNPGYVNIERLKRYLTFSPDANKDFEDDIQIRYEKLGSLGMLLSAHARALKGKTKQEMEDYKFFSFSSYAEYLGLAIPTYLTSALDQSFFANTNTLLNVIKDSGRYGPSWLKQTLSAYGAIFIPSTAIGIYNALGPDENGYAKLTKNADYVKELEMSLKNRYFMKGDLKNQISLWGNPVSIDPENKARRFAWYMFDPFKVKFKDEVGAPDDQIRDELSKLWLETKNADVFPTAVNKEQLVENGVTIDLEPAEYVDLATTIGSLRTTYFSAVINSHNLVNERGDEVSWDKLSTGYKLKVLGKVYEKAYSEGKTLFLMNNERVRKLAYPPNTLNN